MKLLLIGHGRMGRLVEQLAPQYGCEIAGVVTATSGADAIGSAGPADVAIDFSTASAVPANFSMLAKRGVNVVIGTTGWQHREMEVRVEAERADLGVLVSANFSLGMHVFRLLVEEAARKFAPLADTGAWIHELHHAAKKDAPSGTALMLHSAMQAAGYTRPIDLSSTRAGLIPGTHIVGFDGLADAVTLTHEVRDRAVFAHGALQAAKWLRGRRGWFSMKDLVQGAAR
jgi:4-hydroxy-tetrahydrodipicolinate reductase